MTFQGCSLPSFDSLSQAVSEEKIFKKSTNHKEEWFVAAMFVNGSGRNEQSLNRTFHRCFTPSVGSFGQAVSEKILNNRPFKNNNCLWQPCLLMDRDKISNRNKGHSIDDSYQVSTDDGIRRPSDGKSSRCLWQGELKIRNITFHIKK